MNSRQRVCAAACALLFGTAGTALAQQANVGAGISAADSSFMQHAAADGIAEVQMGKMALNKSSDAQVKKLAQRIVDDHTKANDQLKALAAGKHVDLPSAPSATAQKEAKHLNAMKGTAFDKAWAKDMLADHRKAVKMFDTASSKAGDAQVKAFASATLPTLKTHLQMAGQLGMSAARDSAMDHAMPMMDTAVAPAMPVSAAPTNTLPAAAASTH